MVTLEQQIAQKEAELTRLRERKRTLANGQKIIVGGMAIAHAEKDKAFREQLLQLMQTHITRDADKKRILPLIESLRAM